MSGSRDWFVFGSGLNLFPAVLSKIIFIEVIRPLLIQIAPEDEHGVAIENGRVLVSADRHVSPGHDPLPLADPEVQGDEVPRFPATVGPAVEESFVSEDDDGVSGNGAWVVARGHFYPLGTRQVA